MGGPDTPDNVVSVCPNTHAATHQLLRLTGLRYDGDTPWWIRRRFSTLARDLAWDGWTAWNEAGRPVDRQRWIWQGTKVAVPSTHTLIVSVMRRSAHDRNDARKMERDRYWSVLSDAVDLAAEMRPYVPDYFADKWAHDDELERLRQTLKEQQ